MYEYKEPQVPDTKFNNFLESFVFIFKLIFIGLPAVIIFAVIGFAILKLAFGFVF
jgi:hypothetical protein